MRSLIQYLNSQEAAKILGVNVSTVKRWTEDGKLNCIKSAGGHRKFLMKHLSEFLADYKKKAVKVSLFTLDGESDLEINLAILKKDFDYLVTYVLTQSLENNRDRIQLVLDGLYLAQDSLAIIYDLLVTPVLHQIGELWQMQTISITQEHLASQAIKDSIIRLQGIVKIPTEKKTNILCLNFSNELHDIALKMIDNLLESLGYRVLFCGSQTPMVNIEEVFQSYQIGSVFTSITTNSTYTQQELDMLCQVCHTHQASLYIGGQGAKFLDTSHHALKGILKNFSALQEMTNEL